MLYNENWSQVNKLNRNKFNMIITFSRYKYYCVHIYKMKHSDIIFKKNTEKHFKNQFTNVLSFPWKYFAKTFSKFGWFVIFSTKNKHCLYITLTKMASSLTKHSKILAIDCVIHVKKLTYRKLMFGNSCSFFSGLKISKLRVFQWKEKKFHFTTNFFYVTSSHAYF